MKNLLALWTSLIILTGCGSVNSDKEDLSFCEKNGDKTFASGTGQSSDPYLICNATQFKNISQELSSSFKLVKDIDFDSEEYSLPLSFSGEIKGQQYRIKNIVVSKSETNTALFKEVNNANFENIIFDNVSITNTLDGASFFGNAQNSNFKNIQVMNSTIDGEDNVGFVNLSTGSSFENIAILSSDFSGKDNVGGLIAESSDSTILNIVNKSSILGQYKTGGIIGLVKNNLTEENVLNEGTIRGQDATGGIFGLIESDIEISKIHNKGIVHATQGYSVGGLIGESNITKLSESSNSANVFGDTDVGGLIGIVLENSSNRLNINNVFNTGTINSAGGFAGGIVGNLESSPAYSEFFFSNIYSYGNIISSSNRTGVFFGAIYGFLRPGYSCSEMIYSSDISNISNPIGPDDENYSCPSFRDVSLSDSQNIATYSTWDISESDLSTLWNLQENKYPEFN